MPELEILPLIGGKFRRIKEEFGKKYSKSLFARCYRRISFKLLSCFVFGLTASISVSWNGNSKQICSHRSMEDERINSILAV